VSWRRRNHPSQSQHLIRADVVRPYLPIATVYDIVDTMATYIVPIMEPAAVDPVSQNAVPNVAQVEKMPATTTASPKRPSALGTSARVTISLDSAPRLAYGERAPLRRDSMERREALLKGKEGSRQRRRWENGTPPPIPIRRRGWLM
jgi:hypothetical protein